MRHYPPAVLAIAETLIDPDKPDAQDQDLYFSLSGYIGACAILFCGLGVRGWGLFCFIVVEGLGGGVDF